MVIMFDINQWFWMILIYLVIRWDLAGFPNMSTELVAGSSGSLEESEAGYSML